MNLVGSLVSGAVVATVLWQAGSLRGGDAGLTLSYATQFVQAVMQTNPKPKPKPNPNPKPNPKPKPNPNPDQVAKWQADGSLEKVAKLTAFAEQEVGLGLGLGLGLGSLTL